MEFSFEIPAWIKTLIDQPVYIVVWAAFGVFFGAMIITLILSWIGKIVSTKALDNIIIPLVSAIMLTWITGFLSMIILLFTGLSGIKMLLIWISIFVGYLVFSILNRRAIERFANDIGTKKTS